MTARFAVLIAVPVIALVLAVHGNRGIAGSTGEDPAAGCPADITDDGVIDGLDLGLMLAAWGPADGDPADLNGDEAIDGTDIGLLLAAWGPCVPGPYLGDYGNSGCLRDYPWCGDELIELVVEGSALHVVHHQATYNCCPIDILVSLSVQGAIVTLTETEVLTIPCDCLCCFDVESTVLDLAPGAYTLQYCWVDDEAGFTCLEAPFQVE